MDLLNTFVRHCSATTFYRHQLMLTEQLQPALVLIGHEDGIERRANVLDICIVVK